MDTIKFKWDENKNLINQKKHKISFEEAQTVFYDTEALVIDDPSIRWRRTDLSFSALAEKLIYLWYVIVIGNLTLPYELFQQEKQLQLNQSNITNFREAFYYERRI